MKIKLFSTLVVALLLVSSASAQTSTVLAEADLLREQGRFEQARQMLEPLKDERPSDAKVLWRLSRTLVDLGERAPSEDQQKRLYREALAVAEQGIEADELEAEAHLARAIAAGRVGLISGTKEKIELSRVVKESTDRTLELDPDHDTALHVRGRWHYEVSSLGFLERAVVKVVYGGLPEASFEQAAADFERAIDIADAVRHRVELGKTYLKLDRDEEAEAQFEQALSMPNTDPDDDELKREARELLGR